MFSLVLLSSLRTEAFSWMAMAIKIPSMDIVVHMCANAKCFPYLLVLHE